jgi:hypothetical protein
VGIDGGLAHGSWCRLTGIEPATSALQKRRSTSELNRQAPDRSKTEDYCNCPLNEARFADVNARLRAPSDRTIKVSGVGSTLWHTASFFT